MRKATPALFTVALLMLTVGCSLQSSMNMSTGGTANTVPVGLTVTDSPPNGVTVLFFQLSITAATLSPGNVSLLSGSGPIPVNISQLLTESELLGSRNVPAGTYTGLSLTFANPQLTIFNGGAAAIGGCAPGTVCQLTPTATPLTLNFTSAPFPIALSANSPLAFKLDIHLDTVIQPDLSVNLAAANGVTLSQLPPPSAGQPVPRIGKLRGTVQSVGTNQFTLQPGDGRIFTISVNSSTTFNYPDSVCTADTFSCVMTQQVVTATVSLQPDGSLLAVEVIYVQPVGQLDLIGDIVGLSTSNGNTMMDLILEGQPYIPAATAAPLGKHARVTVPSTGVTYSIDSKGFSIPAGLSFAGAADLQVGQEVLVAVQGILMPATAGGMDSTGPLPVGPAAVTFTASSIELEPSQITGTVSAVDSTSLSFTLETFPIFFVPPSPTAGAPPTWAPFKITVDTTSATTFLNFGAGSFPVEAGDVVSVRGWLFATPGGSTPTTLLADDVLLRPGPIPLF